MQAFIRRRRGYIYTYASSQNAKRTPTEACVSSPLLRRSRGARYRRILWMWRASGRSRRRSWRGRKTGDWTLSRRIGACNAYTQSTRRCKIGCTGPGWEYGLLQGRSLLLRVGLTRLRHRVLICRICAALRVYRHVFLIVRLPVFFRAYPHRVNTNQTTAHGDVTHL